MTIRPILALAALLAGGSVHAQTVPPPSGQSMRGMGNMPGMAAASKTDMNDLMKQCARMRAEMKAGMKMTPDMQPMMDHCDKLDPDVGVTKAPDDTLSR